MDMAFHGPVAGEGDGLILLSHRGTKRQTTDALGAGPRRRRRHGDHRRPGRAGHRRRDLPAGALAGVHVEPHRRADGLAHLATALGAELGELDAVPDAVAESLADDLDVPPPPRLLEFMGAGPNQWTAAEASLKVRETAYVAAEGLGVEQLMHGPSVALGEEDALVAFDGGGPARAG